MTRQRTRPGESLSGCAESPVGGISAGTPPAAALAPARRPLTVSELGQLGVRCREPLLPRTEINEHGDAVLDTDDTAQAVPVVRHSVLHGELLDRRSGGDLEGACGQVAPGHGAGSFHYHQYALTRRPIRGAVCGTRLIALPGGRRHQRRGTADEAGEQGVRPV